ncbi:tRNA (adenosine(37)-N6)-threonylcarbamoyltransferase complex ATPase subunit type 1 TsaE [Lacimicrobium alkaliphilum]|uniref:tRNA threonylcarbamoyladenosine biosynthesis protein TsaE n=1 Tax=Lacimicrobium alkaliphilum TaxID=1526571 RepID=A0ABQ1RT17_9ALTE|nr:tRNA (adenosine(37)-N6)-threonylcarbamoyltransferase complex ATPase subunit type 1 TsaE [Lacimicrobium alkaliphilum]GGD76367.1 tRNA (adenosine(37)-N6)-threonylcarbamoyltransferase complex ATPase subunit type 1 TsaE [Lacimicrobium alkaliphilum]
MKKVVHIADERGTHALAEKLAENCSMATVIYLNGELGAGKTSFCRAFIHALGYQGRVKSPTYTLVEPYETERWRIFHFDLYRLSDPEELEFIGIRDYFQSDCLCLIEWPEKGAGLLAPADLQISIDFSDNGRTISLHGLSEPGIALLQQL